MPIWNEKLQKWGYLYHEEVSHFEWLGIERNNMERMLQFFRYEHLPPNLQEISKPFCNMAKDIAERYPQNPERTVTLRKLLEAKDAAVRTFLYVEQ